MITSTHLDVDDGPDHRLVISFMADMPIWLGEAKISDGNQEFDALTEGRELTEQIFKLPEVHELELASSQNKRGYTCTLTATPAEGITLKDLSIEIRQVVCDHCGCRLGDIKPSEAYDRIVTMQRPDPVLAYSSDAPFPLYDVDVTR